MRLWLTTSVLQADADALTDYSVGVTPFVDNLNERLAASGEGSTVEAVALIYGTGPQRKFRKSHPVPDDQLPRPPLFHLCAPEELPWEGRHPGLFGLWITGAGYAFAHGADYAFFYPVDIEWTYGPDNTVTSPYVYVKMLQEAWSASDLIVGNYTSTSGPKEALERDVVEMLLEAFDDHPQRDSFRAHFQRPFGITRPRSEFWGVSRRLFESLDGIPDLQVDADDPTVHLILHAIRGGFEVMPVELGTYRSGDPANPGAQRARAQRLITAWRGAYEGWQGDRARVERVPVAQFGRLDRLYADMSELGFPRGCPSSPDRPLAFVDKFTGATHEYGLDHVQPPGGLFFRGANRESLNARCCVGFGGTVSPTADGMKLATLLGAVAAEGGATVIAGGVYGVDTGSILGALDASGEVVAVLANDVSHGLHPYWPKRRAIERDVLASGGLLSEYGEHVPIPEQAGRSQLGPEIEWRLLQRDRVITGLCDVFVVVESKAGSATVDSAQRARIQGRRVLAVDWDRIPGRWHQPIRSGNDALITTGIAERFPSRSAGSPSEVAAEFREIVALASAKPAEFTLHSGGAEGSDSAFGENAEDSKVAERHYSFDGHKGCRSKGSVVLTADQLAVANWHLLHVVGDAFARLAPAQQTRKYWQRNWYQVERAGEVFVVVKGDLRGFLDFRPPTDQKELDIQGAAVAVALAVELRPDCKRVCLYLQDVKQWVVWSRDASLSPATPPCGDPKVANYTMTQGGVVRVTPLAFVPVEEPLVWIREREFAGIGTRKPNPAALDAVQRLFERSFR